MDLPRPHSRLTSNALIYAAGLALEKAGSLLLLPIYSRSMSIEEYGVVGFCRALESILGILFLLSLHGAVSRFTAAGNVTPEKMTRIMGTVFNLVLANTIILATVLILTHTVVLDRFAAGVSFSPYLLLTIGNAALWGLFSVSQTLHQARQTAWPFAVNQLQYAVVNVAVQVFLVSVVHLAALGVLVGIFATNAVFAGSVLFRHRQSLRLGIERTLVAAILRYSLPLVPHAFSGWLTVFGNRFFINGIEGAASVGVFAVGFQIAAVMNMVTSAVNQAYAPWYFDQAEQGEAGRRRIAGVVSAAVLGYSSIACAVALLSEDLLSVLVRGGYRDGWRVVPLVVFGNVWTGLYYFGVAPLFRLRTALVPFVTIPAAILTVFLNAWLIPSHGVMGAAIASAASMFLTSVFAFALAPKGDPGRLNPLRLYATTVGFFSLSLLAYSDHLALPGKLVLVTVVLGTATLRLRRIMRTGEDLARV